MIILLDKSSIPEIHQIIIRSFQTVADEFGFTKDNAPTFPAFILQSNVEEMIDRGCVFMGWVENEKIAGIVAIEHAHDDFYYLERLSVLPEYRRLGVGWKLMDAAFEGVEKRGGKEVSIAIVDTNTVLKNWYLNYGFEITQTKTISHLPFPVTFMRKRVKIR